MNAHTGALLTFLLYLGDKMSRKMLRVDDFGTLLIPRDGNDTTVLLLDLTEEEFVAV